MFEFLKELGRGDGAELAEARNWIAGQGVADPVRIAHRTAPRLKDKPGYSEGLWEAANRTARLPNLWGRWTAEKPTPTDPDKLFEAFCRK